MRSLSPSTTLVWTRTVSPTANSILFLRRCSDSILSSSAWFINSYLTSALLIRYITKITASPDAVPESEAWPAHHASGQFPHDCPTTKHPAPSCLENRPAAYIADIPTGHG